MFDAVVMWAFGSGCVARVGDDVWVPVVSAEYTCMPWLYTAYMYMVKVGISGWSVA